MLTGLTIQNVVLIDRLSLDSAAGLCALTGETGAGKSILLDALGLALGTRADAKLVRHGTEQAIVTAAFDVPLAHSVHGVLQEKGIETNDGLILRRVVGKDGRSKAFINDAPVSVQLLKEAGALLVEIHGQFATQGLLDSATHRRVLDEYAGLSGDVKAVRGLWATWQGAQEKLTTALNDIETIKAQEEYLKYAVAELEKLNPKIGEEDKLAKQRRILLDFERTKDIFTRAEELLEGENGIQSQIGRLETVLGNLGEQSGAVMEALKRAKAEVEDTSWQIERLKAGGGDGANLTTIEDRYFALKDCAKKHRCIADDLPKLYEDLSQKLQLITHQDDAIAGLEKDVEVARGKYIVQAEKNSAKRVTFAEKLSGAVQKELPDLKMDKATFVVDCTQLEETQWAAEGMDKVQLTVSTNPQTPAGPLHKIASGGEMSRFMLALKVVLAETGSVPTLVFDEVDSGIGGATADAVGESLARLADKYQVLVVTHSPQVAARAAHHWYIAKTEQKGVVLTQILPLMKIKDRQEEIARMLSGATVTKEARAQAARLLGTKNVA